MKSFQECVTTLEEILKQAKIPNKDVRPELDAFFKEIKKDFSQLPNENSDSPANSIETQYLFYTLLKPAFEYYENSRDGRMISDRKALSDLQKMIGAPMHERTNSYRMKLQDDEKKKSDELMRQRVELQQSVSNIFQSLVSFNLPNVQVVPQSNVDVIIVRTVLSSPQHKILGIESGGHSAIECRKKDGASIFFGFYVHEPAEAPTLMAKLAKMLGFPSPDKKVARFVEFKDDHLKNHYEEICIPCNGTLSIEKAMVYLVEHKLSDFDSQSFEPQPQRRDYQLYSKNCSTFVREALMKAQGEYPLPYDGATIFGLDTPMAVRAYAQQLRDKVFFEEAKKIRQTSPIEDDKAHVIQAITALEAFDMTDASERDRLLVHVLVHRLRRVVNFPVEIPSLYQDVQTLIERIQQLKSESPQLEHIHRILLTATQSLSAYRQQVELTTIKDKIVKAICLMRLNISLDPASLTTFSEALGFINTTLADTKNAYNDEKVSNACNQLELIRGMLYEQMYFQRDAACQNKLIKQINHWILPNMQYEEIQPSMSSLVDMAIEALSIPPSTPFHQREGETKIALKAMIKESSVALPAQLQAVKQTMNAHAPWWVRWLPRWALFTKSLRDTQDRFVQLEHQTQLLCVMDAFVKGKITPHEWESHLKQFEDWLSVDTVNSWTNFIDDDSSYSKMLNQFGIQSQTVVEKSLEQEGTLYPVVNTPHFQPSADTDSDLEEDEQSGMRL